MSKTPTFPPGCYVAPLKAGTKDGQLLASWKTEASNDPKQIAEWSKQWPGCNWLVNVDKSGLAILDIDPPTGEDSFFQFELDHGFLPETREHRSARGGRHLIFSDPEHKLRNTVGKLGPKLDTRGSLDGTAGYIVIPPSTFEGGSYTVTHDRPIVPVPQSVIDAAGASRERVAADPSIPLDTKGAKCRARKLLSDYRNAGHIAIEGQGTGDALTYAVAAEVLSLGLSEDGAFEVMQDWDAACQPPWGEELRIKIANAGQYAQCDAGAYYVPPVEQRIPPEPLQKLIAASVANAEAAPGTAIAPKVKGGKPAITARDLLKMNFPKPWYLVQGQLLGGRVNMFNSEEGLGKSSLIQQVGTCCAARLPFFDRETKPVFFLAIFAEDDEGAIADRFKRQCAYLGITDEDAKNLPWEAYCEPDFDTQLAQIDDDGQITKGPFWEKLIGHLERIRRDYPDLHILLFLDTAIDLVALDENSRPAVNAFLKTLLPSICKGFNATVIVTAHVSGAQKMAGTYSSGTTQWRAGVRARTTLRRGIEDDKKDLSRIWELAKANYGGEGTQIRYYNVEGVAVAEPPETIKRKDDNETEAVFSEIVELRRALICIVPANGNGLKPKDLKRNIEKKGGPVLSVARIKEVLAQLVSEKRIKYRAGQTGSHRPASYVVIGVAWEDPE